MPPRAKKGFKKLKANETHSATPRTMRWVLLMLVAALFLILSCVLVIATIVDDDTERAILLAVGLVAASAPPPPPLSPPPSPPPLPPPPPPPQLVQRCPVQIASPSTRAMAARPYRSVKFSWSWPRDFRAEKNNSRYRRRRHRRGSFLPPS